MFGENLKRLRKEHKLSQEKMAAQLNIPCRTYGSWERGEREPDFQTLCRIADLFSISTDSLLGRVPMNVEVKYEKPPALAEGQHEVSVTIPDGLSQSELESRLEQLVQRLVRQELHRQSEE